MDHNKLGCGIALGLLSVSDDERVVDAVVVTPPPSLDALVEVVQSSVGVEGVDVDRIATAVQ